MTIQEAIKSGLPFKRPSWTGWCEPNNGTVRRVEPHARGTYQSMSCKSRTVWGKRRIMKNHRWQLHMHLDFKTGLLLLANPTHNCIRCDKLSNRRLTVEQKKMKRTDV